jgi:hypothetical protein
MADYDLYLLWIPTEGWGIFNMGSCPDPAAFPSWMFRKYTIPIEQHDKVFKRLMHIKEKLDENVVLPSAETERKIFPELSDLLKD